MDHSEVIAFISALDGVTSSAVDGNSFFSCTEDEASPSNHWMPFATVITNDAYDELVFALAELLYAKDCKEEEG